MPETNGGKKLTVKLFWIGAFSGDADEKPVHALVVVAVTQESALRIARDYAAGRWSSFRCLHEVEAVEDIAPRVIGDGRMGDAS